MRIERVKADAKTVIQVTEFLRLGDGLGIDRNAATNHAELLSGAWLEVRAESIDVDDVASDHGEEVNDALDYLSGHGGGILLHRHGTLMASQVAMAPKTGLIGSGYGSVIKQLPDQHTQVDTGTSSGSNTALILNDTAQAWTQAEFVQHTCHITGGTGSGQTRLITFNTTTQLQFDDPWDTTPDATSTYEILAPTPLILSTGGSDVTLISDLFLDGNNANQTAQNPLIRLKHLLNPQDDGADEFDVHHIVRNVWGKRASASAISIGKGVREARFINCKLSENNRFGIEGEFEGGTDLWFLHNTAWENGMAGFYVNNWGSHWSFNKAFGNGKRVENNGAPNGGFHIVSEGLFMNGCNAQENYGNGFRFINSFHVTASDLTADANGNTGVYCNNVQDSYIQALVRSTPGLLYQTPWALKLEDGPGAGEETDRNEIHIQALASELSDGVLDPASVVNADNWLFVNNRMFGRWHALGREAIGTAEEHIIIGKNVGSGLGTTGNPYYAWKTLADAVPSSALVGHDGTTERIFVTLDFDGKILLLGQAGGPPFGAVEIAYPSLRPETNQGTGLGSSTQRFANTFISGRVDSITSSEAFRYGKSGSGTSGNPYLTFKHDNASSPVFRIETWDGTTALTYLEMDHDSGLLNLGESGVDVAFFGGTGSGQRSAIPDVPTAGSATAADNATAINSILAALRAFGLIAT